MTFNKISDFGVHAGMIYDFGAVGIVCMYFVWRKDMNFGGSGAECGVLNICVLPRFIC